MSINLHFKKYFNKWSPMKVTLSILTICKEIIRNLYVIFMNLWWLAPVTFHLVKVTTLADFWAFYPLICFVCCLDIFRCSTNWSGTQCERPAPRSSKSDHISTSKFLRLIFWVIYTVYKSLLCHYWVRWVLEHFLHGIL